MPTLIVTDYFRKAFVLEYDRPVSGLLYRSARNGAGTCCALFVDRDACADAGSDAAADALLVLEGHETRRPSLVMVIVHALKRLVGG